MRLSEAYLTRAEAKFRLGEDATEDINTLRRRANCTRLVQTVTEKEIIDEWAREFYLEGRRRSDLIRFDMFTSNKYLWDWRWSSNRNFCFFFLQCLSYPGIGYE